MTYDYIIVGAGIAGCSVAYFLHEKEPTKKILILDRHSDIARGASGAAGAFLSPLLGKPNKLKNLVNKSLAFSTNLYKNIASEFIINQGVQRIPKDKDDEKKFLSYMEFNDFSYELKDEGAFFPIGSKVNSLEICKILSQKSEKKFNYEVNHMSYSDDLWLINNELQTKNLILTTGADISLIDEYYYNIRAVWGQRIDIKTSTKVSHNYHKECSLSVSEKIRDKEGLYTSTIGATHHRFDCDNRTHYKCLKKEDVLDCNDFPYTKEIYNNDTEKLLSLASDIMALKDVRVVNAKVGARASSVDFFPMVGKLIDAKKTINKFPYIINGTHVQKDRFDCHPNLYVLNGVSGRGFVLSPYLASQLVDFMVEDKKLEEEITVHRLFTRWVRTKKAKEIVSKQGYLN